MNKEIVAPIIEGMTFYNTLVFDDQDIEVVCPNCGETNYLTFYKLYSSSVGEVHNITGECEYCEHDLEAKIKLTKVEATMEIINAETPEPEPNKEETGYQVFNKTTGSYMDLDFSGSAFNLEEACEVLNKWYKTH
jgi:hypothetical protein